jgi:hypothetical protein
MLVGRNAGRDVEAANASAAGTNRPCTISSRAVARHRRGPSFATSTDPFESTAMTWPKGFLKYPFTVGSDLGLVAWRRGDLISVAMC